MRTVMVSHVITDVLCIIVVFLLWRQSRGRYRGITHWLAGFGLQLLGTVLILFRSAVPDWISMTVASTAIIAGAMAVTGGIRRFIGRTRSRLPAVVLAAVFAGVNFYFVQFAPNLKARNMAFSAAFTIIFIDVLRLIFRTRTEVRRLLDRIGLAYAALLLAGLVRIVLIIAGPPEDQDFFRAAAFETLVILAYQALFILLTYDLALAVNERLIGDLRFQEEKFAKAFRSSPFGFVLKDAFTDLVFDVNEGFSEITGYSREEAVGKPIPALKLWESDAEHDRVQEELNTRGRIRDLERPFRMKSGALIPCLWSADVLTIGGRPCVLSCLNDISILKRAQDDLHRSLAEKDLLMRELRHRVKNSLALVSSLLGLIRTEAEEAAFRNVLSELRSRIGLVSSVYEQLDRTGGVETIGLQDYIGNLTGALAKTYGPPDGRIGIATELQAMAVDTNKALSLGLIINELVMGAFAHAFPGGRAGEIRIELLSAGDGGCLIVSDDGIGRRLDETLPAGGTEASLVEMLADQMGARITFPPGSGTTAVVMF